MPITLRDLQAWHVDRAAYFEDMRKTHEDFAASPNATRYNLEKEYLHRAKAYGKDAKFHADAAKLLGEIIR